MNIIITNPQGLEFKDGDVFKTKSSFAGHSTFIIYGVSDDYEVYYVNLNNIVGNKYRGNIKELIGFECSQDSGIEILYNAFEEGEQND